MYRPGNYSESTMHSLSSARSAEGQNMTTSFRLRIKSTCWTLVLVPFLASGCSKEAVPTSGETTTKPTTEAKVTVVPTKPATTRHGEIQVTNKVPDPSRMPNDDVHAPFLARQKGHQASKRPAQPKVETDDHSSHPLVMKGPRSVAELNDRLAKEADESVRKRLAKAFRLTFTTAGDRQKRRTDALAAGQLLTGLDTGSAGATAQRIMAYVAIRGGLGFKKSQGHYAKSVELDPNYGAAHYGLAFSLLFPPVTAETRARGRQHFDRAMALGVEDSNKIRRHFYPSKP
jgi:hypothetical protein